MKRLFLDSGAVDRLAAEDLHASALISELRREGFWPPIVHPVVLAECLSGRADKDVRVHRLIKTCHVPEALPRRVAQRAGELRTKSRRGSVVDALVVAMAEEISGVVLTDDNKDMRALATHARGVTVRSSKPRSRGKRG